MSTSRPEPSLLEHLDLSQLNCLNEIADHNLKGLLAKKARNTADDYLLSDTDEQLLLNIHFNQSVRVRSIVLHTSESQKGPKSIKLLVNRPALGFEDVENAEEPEAAQVLEIPEDAVREGRPIALRFVRFQTVNSLHIFVNSNHGGEDATRIDAIDVFGFPSGTGKDWSELKKQADE
ncbi:PITH domain-containing protein [Gloeopeniophorella convolvens]|nr:PITH domain-containing protein [Gloeopeniophorella convolvens]